MIPSPLFRRVDKSRTTLLNRTAGIVLFVFLTQIATAVAQVRTTADWANVHLLASRHARVVVTTRDQAVTDGTVSSVSDDAIIVNSTTGTTTIPRQSISSIVRPGTSSASVLVTRISVGALSGAGYAWLVRAFEETPDAKKVAIAFGVGFGIGWLATWKVKPQSPTVVYALP